jgi:hypothetical protein
MRLDPSGFDSAGGMQRVYTLLSTFRSPVRLFTTERLNCKETWHALCYAWACVHSKGEGSLDKMQIPENSS